MSETSRATTQRHWRRRFLTPITILMLVANAAPFVAPVAAASLSDFGEPFHFLEPLAPASGDPERFDGSLLHDLVVEICRVEAAACTHVKTLTSEGSTSEQLRIESTRKDGSYYIANWDTQKLKLSPDTYRVRVAVAGLELGSLDLAPGQYGSFGRTWPIKFLIQNDPTIRIRILRSHDQSASQVANAIRIEFDLGPDDVAELLARDLEPYSDAEIELALAGVFQPAVVPPTTKIADAATRDALTTFDPGTGTMAFSATTPVLDALDVGDVLVGEPASAAPFGYLRKVVSITKEKRGGVVIETTQALINDVVEEGTLEAAGELQPDDLLEVVPEFPGVTFIDQQAATAGFGALDVGGGYNFHETIDVTLEGAAAGDGVSGTGTVRIQGEVRFNAGYNVGFGVEPCLELPPVCVDRFEAHIGIDHYSDIRVSGTFDGTLDKEVVLSTHYFKPIVFFIGPVPVVLVPIVKAIAGVRGDAHLEYSFAAQVSTRLQLGAKWTDPEDGGVGWQNVSTPPVLSAPPPTADLEASMELRAYAEAEARLLLYGIAGPGFEGRVGVGADVKFPRNPLWFVFGHASADISFAVDLGGILKLAEYKSPLAEVRFNLAQSANQPPVCGARQDPIPVAVGADTYLGPRFGGIFDGYFDCNDPEGELLSYSAVSDGGPLNLSRARWDLPGLHVVTITATDESDVSTTFTITVNVINTPPLLTLTSAMNTVPASVQYFVTASAFDVEIGDFVPCTSLSWTASAGTVTPTLDNRTCTAVVVFPAAGTHTITVMATDIHGAKSTETLTVNVTAAPANPAPVIDPNSFRVFAEQGPKSFCPDDEPLCDTRYVCPTGFFCEVPFDAVLYNGTVGDYHPPITFSLSASDPNGDAVQVTWFCSAGSNAFPVTDNGDGTSSCSPWSSSVSIPIVVRAQVSDGVTTVSSEVRKFIMLDRVG